VKEEKCYGDSGPSKGHFSAIKRIFGEYVSAKEFVTWQGDDDKGIPLQPLMRMTTGRG